MKILKYVFAIALLGTAMPMMTACGDEDSGYEEMGDNIGDTGREMGDEIGDTGREIGDEFSEPVE